MINCAPLYSFEKMSDSQLKTSITYWDDVINSHSELIKPICPFRKERIVPDVQIVAGYMHAGYPIMVQMDVCQYEGDKIPRIFGFEDPNPWGIYHEIGHNFQRNYWNFPGTIEVTVNLFSLYSFEKLLNTKSKSPNIKHLVDSRNRSQKYLDEGAKYNAWKKDPWLGLVLYAEILEAFGWEPYKKTLLEYEDELEKGVKMPSTDEEKIQTWIKKLSINCKKDLRKFFRIWGIPYTNFDSAELSALPEMKR